MKIVAVRHGQTEGNVQKIIQSRTDGKLTELGIQQAKEAAEKLSTYSFDKIYCSTLGRCRETVSYIAQYHQDVRVEFTDKLIELSKGELEGKPWDTLPEYFFTESHIDKGAPGGESWLDLDSRLRNFLNELFNTSLDTVLLVTHDGPLKVLHSILQDIPLGEAIGFSYNNAGVYELTMDAKVAQRVQYQS